MKAFSIDYCLKKMVFDRNNISLSGNFFLLQILISMYVTPLRLFFDLQE